MTCIVKECIVLQDKFNSVVNPEWKKANYPWKRAAWKEASELLDHVGYKWWKKTEPNIFQAKLEIVDIFHFLLSICIVKGYDENTIIGAFNKADRTKYEFDNEIFNQKVEYFIETVLTGGNSIAVFFELVCMLGMTLSELCTMYIQKNALNNFRQMNGDKKGDYLRLWNGVEDNVVLENLVASGIDISFDNIIVQLGLIYEGIKNEIK